MFYARILCFYGLTSRKWRAYNQYLMRRRYGNEGQISSEIPFRYLCPFEVVHFPPPTSSINRPNPISHCIALREILHISWSYLCSEFIILSIPYISQHASQNIPPHHNLTIIWTLQNFAFLKADYFIFTLRVGCSSRKLFSRYSEFLMFMNRDRDATIFCRWFTKLLEFALPLSS